MKHLLSAFLLSVAPLAAEAIEADLSGNLEGQFRNATNNDEAKEAPLFQDWDNENFFLAYGNVNAKVELGDSRVEANWFGRYGQSPLYESEPFGPFRVDRGPYLATNVFTFPQRLVARDVFKLQHVDQDGTRRTESILNKLYYEWDYGDHRFMAGRMYVNYGLGEIFNPINPFNQPTALTAISQVAQGNDGFSLTFFVNEIHTVQFLLLGDKRIEGYDGQIERTLWIHGEVQASDDLQLDYVIGEDQNRQKVGGQVSYQLAEALVFAQALYQSENVRGTDESHNLWDALLGYDQQVTNKWHIRFEGGYQKRNRFATPENFERFLPTEYFAALANVYELHPLVKVSGTLINDVKSGFSYAVAKATVSLTKSTELEAFGFSPVSRGDAADNLAQKLVTQDVGLAIRAFF
jgi:hypothetical protein